MTAARMLHPPRTGGTSIVKAWNLTTPEYQGHSLPAYTVGAAKPFTYCTVRNPWARVVSVWAMLHGRRFQDSPFGAELEMFESWVRHGFELPGVAAISHIDGMPVLAPCMAWAQHADFVVRLEVPEELDQLAARLGRKTPRLHENRSEHRDPKLYYQSRAVADIVADTFRVDAEAFDYFSLAPL